MKSIFTIFLLVLSVTKSYAQKDSAVVVATDQLVKGFYKSYREFVNNAPSIKRDFSMQKFTRFENDTMVIAALYELPDSLDNFGEVWGFSDGIDAYVSSGTFSKRRYWRVQCKGPNPYVYYNLKGGVLLPLNAAAVVVTIVQAIRPPDIEVMMIDNEGKVKNIDAPGTLRPLLKKNAELFKRYKSELRITDDIAIKYLEEYNRWKLSNP